MALTSLTAIAAVPGSLRLLAFGDSLTDGWTSFSSGPQARYAGHLQKALQIQSRQLGPRHVSTLCSQLVRAQVMLLQANTVGCARLLTKQVRAFSLL